MTRRQRRLAFLISGLGLLALAALLVVVALGDRTLYFYSPADAKARNLPVGQIVNLGGLVAKDSLAPLDGTRTQFVVTDGLAQVSVIAVGDLPDLFREGQGVVVTGAFRPDGVFEATRVLAKHDEKYMPPEVARALKARGVWKEGEPAP
jgi:cytochrome c-type biogenesis protein CcmE